jgi:hypothetical protein
VDGVRLTERDVELLSFLAEHRLALPTHVAALLDTSAAAACTRMGKLARAGYLRPQDPFPGEPRWYQITRKGLSYIGSRLPTPGVNLREYKHDVGIAWLWLAAQRGTFGPVGEILGARRLRSIDGGREPDAEPLAVRLSGLGPHGREQLHYPDLLLRTADGRRVALELELSPKGRTRLEKILAGYAADPRFAGVVYLVESRAVARSVHTAARRLGISDLVHLQRVRSTVSRSAAASALTAERAPRSRSSSSRSRVPEAIR